jgi:hypothetical protein
MIIEIKYFPILYVWDRDKVREWRISVHGTANNARYRIVHGFSNGLPDEKWTEVVGKNIGKSNATTSYEQAMRDAQALYDKKLKEGYLPDEDFNFETPTERVYGEVNIPKAMLLYKANAPGFIGTGKEKLHAVRFPCYVQEKVDGNFAAATAEHGLVTRGGELTLTPKGQSLAEIFPIINKVVKELIVKFEKEFGERVVLNGELYYPGSNLQDITSACKKEGSLSPLIEYYVFDIYFPNNPDMKQAERYRYYDILAQSIGFGDWYKIQHIPYFRMESWDEIFAYESEVIERGGEGLVIRNINGRYTPGKRSKDVLKLVRFDQTEVWIEDIVPMEKEPTQGIFVCNYAGKEFKVTPSEFDHYQRGNMLRSKHSFIGKKLLIQHRGFTNDGIPRIAKGVKIV